MAVKKRELTVEKWQKLMDRNKEKARQVGTDAFIDIHEAMGHDMLNVLFEIQMSDAWKYGGLQVYDFDRDFSDSIIGEKWTDLLPEVIEYRPCDCFFMKLPCGDDNEGTVVHIVDSDNIMGFDIKLFPGADKGPGVYYGGDFRYGDRVIVNTGDKIYALCQFSISKTIELMLDDTPVMKYPTELVANGVAYLCSANADIVAVYKPKKEKRRNNAKKRSQATWHEVGYRIGAELRNYMRVKYERGEKTGRTVRPHMRRAHWHHYWIGPRNGERRLVLKWVAPTMVGVGIDSATLHKVS